MEQFEGLFEHYIWTTEGAEKFKHELESKETQNRFEKYYISVMVDIITMQTFPQ